MGKVQDVINKIKAGKPKSAEGVKGPTVTLLPGEEIDFKKAKREFKNPLARNFDETAREGPETGEGSPEVDETGVGPENRHEALAASTHENLPTVIIEAAPAGVFDYAVIRDPTARAIAQKASAEIKARTSKSIKLFVEMGALLAKVKANLASGTFQRWAELEVGYSARHVNNFIRVADRFGTRDDVGKLLLAPTTLLRLSEVDDEETFERLVALAKVEHLTESRISLEIAGARTEDHTPRNGTDDDPDGDEDRETERDPAVDAVSTTTPSSPPVNRSTPGAAPGKPERGTAASAVRWAEDIRRGGLLVVSSLVAVENLPAPRVGADAEKAREAAKAIRLELAKIVRAILPFFTPEEVDEMNRAPERRIVAPTKATVSVAAEN